ncbi:uncharacterized protein ISCGN_006922 [Ixodes scapularis]
MSDEALIEVLGQYGKVKSLSHVTYRHQPDIRTGTRVVKLEMSKPIPSFIHIQGHRVMVECSQYGQEGHFCMVAGAFFVTFLLGSSASPLDLAPNQVPRNDNFSSIPPQFAEQDWHRTVFVSSSTKCSTVGWQRCSSCGDKRGVFKRKPYAPSFGHDTDCRMRYSCPIVSQVAGAFFVTFLLGSSASPLDLAPNQVPRNDNFSSIPPQFAEQDWHRTVFVSSSTECSTVGWQRCSSCGDKRGVFKRKPYAPSFGHDTDCRMRYSCPIVSQVAGAFFVTFLLGSSASPLDLAPNQVPRNDNFSSIPPQFAEQDWHRTVFVSSSTECSTVGWQRCSSCGDKRGVFKRKPYAPSFGHDTDCRMRYSCPIVSQVAGAFFVTFLLGSSASPLDLAPNQVPRNDNFSSIPPQFAEQDWHRTVFVSSSTKCSTVGWQRCSSCGDKRGVFKRKPYAPSFGHDTDCRMRYSCPIVSQVAGAFFVMFLLGSSASPLDLAPNQVPRNDNFSSIPPQFAEQDWHRTVFVSSSTKCSTVGWQRCSSCGDKRGVFKRKPYAPSFGHDTDCRMRYSCPIVSQVAGAFFVMFLLGSSASPLDLAPNQVPRNDNFSSIPPQFAEQDWHRTVFVSSSTKCSTVGWQRCSSCGDKRGVFKRKPYAPSFGHDTDCRMRYSCPIVSQVAGAFFVMFLLGSSASPLDLAPNQVPRNDNFSSIPPQFAEQDWHRTVFVSSSTECSTVGWQRCSSCGDKRGVFKRKPYAPSFGHDTDCRMRYSCPIVSQVAGAFFVMFLLGSSASPLDLAPNQVPRNDNFSSIPPQFAEQDWHRTVFVSSSTECSTVGWQRCSSCGDKRGVFKRKPYAPSFGHDTDCRMRYSCPIVSQVAGAFFVMFLLGSSASPLDLAPNQVPRNDNFSSIPPQFAEQDWHRTVFVSSSTECSTVGWQRCSSCGDERGVFKRKPYAPSFGHDTDCRMRYSCPIVSQVAGAFFVMFLLGSSASPLDLAPNQVPRNDNFSSIPPQFAEQDWHRTVFVSSSTKCSTVGWQRCSSCGDERGVFKRKPYAPSFGHDTDCRMRYSCPIVSQVAGAFFVMFLLGSSASPLDLAPNQVPRNDNFSSIPPQFAEQDWHRTVFVSSSTKCSTVGWQRCSSCGDKRGVFKRKPYAPSFGHDTDCRMRYSCPIVSQVAGAFFVMFLLGSSASPLDLAPNQVPRNDNFSSIPPQFAEQDWHRTVFVSSSTKCSTVGWQRCSSCGDERGVFKRKPYAPSFGHDTDCRMRYSCPIVSQVAGAFFVMFLLGSSASPLDLAPNQVPRNDNFSSIPPQFAEQDWHRTVFVSSSTKCSTVGWQRCSSCGDERGVFKRKPYAPSFGHDTDCRMRYSCPIVSQVAGAFFVMFLLGSSASPLDLAPNQVPRNDNFSSIPPQFAEQDWHRTVFVSSSTECSTVGWQRCSSCGDKRGVFKRKPYAPSFGHDTDCRMRYSCPIVSQVAGAFFVMFLLGSSASPLDLAPNQVPRNDNFSSIPPQFAEQDWHRTVFVSSSTKCSTVGWQRCSSCGDKRGVFKRKPYAPSFGHDTDCRMRYSCPIVSQVAGAFFVMFLLGSSASPLDLAPNQVPRNDNFSSIPPQFAEQDWHRTVFVSSSTKCSTVGWQRCSSCGDKRGVFKRKPYAPSFGHDTDCRMRYSCPIVSQVAGAFFVMFLLGSSASPLDLAPNQVPRNDNFSSIPPQFAEQDWHRTVFVSSSTECSTVGWQRCSSCGDKRGVFKRKPYAPSFGHDTDCRMRYSCPIVSQVAGAFFVTFLLGSSASPLDLAPNQVPRNDNFSSIPPQFAEQDWHRTVFVSSSTKCSTVGWQRCSSCGDKRGVFKRKPYAPSFGHDTDCRMRYSCPIVSQVAGAFFVMFLLGSSASPLDLAPNQVPRNDNFSSIPPQFAEQDWHRTVFVSSSTECSTVGWQRCSSCGDKRGVFKRKPYAPSFGHDTDCRMRYSCPIVSQVAGAFFVTFLLGSSASPLDLAPNQVPRNDNFSSIPPQFAEQDWHRTVFVSSSTECSTVGWQRCSSCGDKRGVFKRKPYAPSFGHDTDCRMRYSCPIVSQVAGAFFVMFLLGSSASPLDLAPNQVPRNDNFSSIPPQFAEQDWHRTVFVSSSTECSTVGWQRCSSCGDKRGVFKRKPYAPSFGHDTDCRMRYSCRIVSQVAGAFFVTFLLGSSASPLDLAPNQVPRNDNFSSIPPQFAEQDWHRTVFVSSSTECSTVGWQRCSSCGDKRGVFKRKPYAPSFGHDTDCRMRYSCRIVSQVAGAFFVMFLLGSSASPLDLAPNQVPRNDNFSSIPPQFAEQDWHRTVFVSSSTECSTVGWQRCSSCGDKRGVFKRKPYAPSFGHDTDCRMRYSCRIVSQVAGAFFVMFLLGSSASPLDLAPNQVPRNDNFSSIPPQFAEQDWHRTVFVSSSTECSTVGWQRCSSCGDKRGVFKRKPYAPSFGHDTDCRMRYSCRIVSQVAGAFFVMFLLGSSASPLDLAPNQVPRNDNFSSIPPQFAEQDWHRTVFVSSSTECSTVGWQRCSSCGDKRGVFKRKPYAPSFGHDTDCRMRHSCRIVSQVAGAFFVMFLLGSSASPLDLAPNQVPRNDNFSSIPPQFAEQDWHRTVFVSSSTECSTVGWQRCSSCGDKRGVFKRKPYAPSFGHDTDCRMRYSCPIVSQVAGAFFVMFLLGSSASPLDLAPNQVPRNDNFSSIPPQFAEQDWHRTVFVSSSTKCSTVGWQRCSSCGDKRGVFKRKPYAPSFGHDTDCRMRYSCPIVSQVAGAFFVMFLLGSSASPLDLAPNQVPRNDNFSSIPPQFAEQDWHRTVFVSSSTKCSTVGWQRCSSCGDKRGVFKRKPYAPSFGHDTDCRMRYSCPIVSQVAGAFFVMFLLGSSASPLDLAPNQVPRNDNFSSIPPQFAEQDWH